MTSYFIDNTGIYASDGRIFKPTSDLTAAEDILSWLLKDNPKENKLLYDLDACVASIIKMTMSQDQAKYLYEHEKTWVNGYKITYFPTRFFSIDGRGSFVNYGNMIRYKSDTHYSPDDTEDDKVNKAKEAKAISIEAHNALKELGLRPERIISPVAALVDKYVWSLRPPTIDDIPDEAGEIAYQTIKGNWLESYQLGYWDKAWDYDINVAYGSVLAKLLDHRRGSWINDTTIPDKAVYGFADGILETDAPFHPFCFKQGEEQTFTPIGRRPEQLPLNMIKLLKYHNLGSFKVDKGWWWIPSETKPPYEPLRGIINHLAKIRSDSEGLKKVILRQMIAGIWGRMIQIKNGAFGDLVNPVWASIVENEIKCQVCHTCLSNNTIPLQVAVDGVITDKPLPIEDSKEIGKWRLSHIGQCIIASSGVVAFEGKQGAEEFALRFDWLKNEIDSKPDNSEYKMTKYSPITLAKSIQNNCFDKLGELQDTSRNIIIGRDYKRQWKDYPHTGKELLENKYESMPIDVIMASNVK